MLERVLAGYKILDLTQNVAGPFCSQVLGDLGATVFKVERRGVGDDSRAWRAADPASRSPHFIALNRNKKSICIDVAAEDGRALVARLAQQCDVFLHSMKPRSAKAFGFDHEALSRLHPRLIHCAISAYGETGPLKDLPGYDPVMQAFTGLMALCGNEGDLPSRVPFSAVDVGTGMWAAIGILGACLERRRSGEGASVQVSLLDTSLGWMNALITAFAMSGSAPGRIGTSLANAAPYELFRTGDGFVFVAAPNDRLFGRLCEALALGHLPADARFETNSGRLAHRPVLHALLEGATAARDTRAVVDALRAAGVPCSEMNGIEQALEHPQVQAAGMVSDWPDAALGKFVELPLQINGSRSRARHAPPALGADTDSILKDAGLDDAAIQQLRDRGTIG